MHIPPSQSIRVYSQDPVYGLTISQYLNIQSLARGLSIYPVSFRLFYSHFQESDTRQSQMVVMVVFLTL